MRSWVCRLGLACAIAITAGGVGYHLGNTRSDTGLLMSVKQTLPLEFYVSSRSFSEVEMAKGQFEALCAQFLANLRSKHFGYLGLTPTGPLTSPCYAIQPEQAIEELAQAVDQFAGTGHERCLVQELLSLLKRHDLRERWLDVYLAFVYKHPTDLMVGRYASDAFEMSELVGRRAELANAFEVVLRIPNEPDLNRTAILHVTRAKLLTSSPVKPLRPSLHELEDADALQ